MMFVFLGFYGFMVAFSVIGFFGDMANANGAPQQAVAAGVAIFTLLVPYTLLKAHYVWASLENQKEILKAISERQQA
jgi:hypothetical protein